VSALPSADSRRFRAAREDEWRRLEALLVRAERKSLPTLYRGALSSLSVARETSLDLELVTYLEGLCARAYFFVYGVRTSPWRRMGVFFGSDWPEAVRSLWKETIVAMLVMLAGALAGFLLVAGDPSWFGAFVPEELAGGRTFDAPAEELRSTLYDRGEGTDLLGAFAALLFTHNSQVAILAFALGFAFGIPTLLLLVYNGTTLGAFVALFVSHGLGAELGGWLIIHGSTELFAIALAGAAGLRIGSAVVFPGERARMAAAAVAGRTAAIAMAGVLIMLFVAGLLEGIGRQTITSDAARYAIGIGVLMLWFGFYYLPRRRADG
jgi:uncharacterized membrane protein SpoIIM required for sporulation